MVEEEYSILICASCRRQEKINGRYEYTDDYKGITILFKFPNEETYEFYDDRGYNSLQHDFDEAVQKIHKGYFSNDILEPYSDRKDLINEYKGPVVDVEKIDMEREAIIDAIGPFWPLLF